KPDCTQTSSLFCIGFLILYSSNMYGDEIYLCNKAIFSYRLLGRFFYLTSLNDQHIKLIKMSVNMEMFYKELIMT
ncbi:hypothetical protein, partial [Acinetobacter baumannii]|uniref:hypothetical protein n=1 Tax=Acinetobacter baumannii TaxID=470 RepID=UPI0039A7127A